MRVRFKIVFFNFNATLAQLILMEIRCRPRLLAIKDSSIPISIMKHGHYCHYSILLLSIARDNAAMRSLALDARDAEYRSWFVEFVERNKIVAIEKQRQA